MALSTSAEVEGYTSGIAILDHDDILHPSAQYEVMKVIEDRDADFIYTDEAIFESTFLQRIQTTHWKPDFAPD